MASLGRLNPFNYFSKPVLTTTAPTAPPPKPANKSYLGNKANLALRENQQTAKNFVNGILLSETSPETTRLKTKLTQAATYPLTITDQDIGEITEQLTAHVPFETSKLEDPDEQALLSRLCERFSKLNEEVRPRPAEEVTESIESDPRAIIEHFFNQDTIALVKKAIPALAKLEKLQKGTWTHIKEEAPQMLLGAEHAHLAAQKGLAGGLTDTVMTTFNEKLTAKDTGLVDRTVSAFDGHLARKPHSQLLRLKEDLEELYDVLLHPSDEKPTPKNYALQAYARIQLINKNPSVFASFPLTQGIQDPQDNETLKYQGMTDYLRGICEEGVDPESRFVEVLVHFVNELCDKQRNPVAKIGKALFQETIQPGLKQLENLPEKLIDNAAKKVKEYLGAGASSNDISGGPQGGRMQGFLQSMGKMFKELVATSAGAISRESLLAICILLTNGIDWLQKKIEKKEGDEFEEQKIRLWNLKKAVKNLKKDPEADISLKTVKGLFLELVRICDTLHICINGYYAPHLTDGQALVEGQDSDDEDEIDGVAPKKSRPTFYNNIQILNNVNKIDTDPVAEDYEALTTQALTTFIQKSSEFMALKISCEWLFWGERHEANFYRRMMNGVHSDQELYGLVREHIRERGSAFYVTWFRLFWAYITFKFLQPWIKGFVEEISHKYTREIFEYIRHQKNHNFESFTSTRLKDALDYFTILNDTFEVIPDIRPAYGSIETMLQKEMEKPERNQGQTVGQIYEEMVQNVFNKAENHWMIAWILGKLRKYFPSMIQSLIDSGMDSFQDANGYSHALNKVMVKFLEKVDESLKNSAEKRIKSEAPQLSGTRKRQLSSLVKILFSILEKSKCEHIKELRKLVRSEKVDEDPVDVLTAILTKVLGINIDTQIVNEIVQSVTLNLADSLETLIQEDQLQKLTYTFIEMLNESFDPNPRTIRIAEKNRTENRVKELASSILRTSIDKAIDEKGNVFKEQREANKAISDLREKTSLWIKSTQMTLQQLQTSRSYDDVRRKARGLCIQAKLFQVERDQEQSQIATKNWDDINREALAKRYLDISESCNPLVEQIAYIEKEMAALENHRFIVPHLQAILNELDSTDGLLYHPNISKCLDQLIELQKSFKNQTMPPFILALQKQLEVLSKKVLKIQEIESEQDLLGQILSPDPASLLNRLITARRETPQNLRIAYLAFQQQIRGTLSIANQRLYLSALDSLSQARIDNLEEEKNRFLEFCNTRSQDANRNYGECANAILEKYEEIRTNITSTGMLSEDFERQPITKVKESTKNALDKLHAFAAQADQVLKNIPFVNAKIIDPKSFKNKVKDIVFKTTKKYTDELLKFAARKDTGYSLVTNLVLRPYNRYEQWRRDNPGLLDQISFVGGADPSTFVANPSDISSDLD